MMGLRAYITQAQQSARSELPLYRKKVVFVVGILVARIRRRHAGLRQERRKIDVWIWITHRRIQGRELQRERLHMNVTVRRANERRGEQRRRRAGVAQSVRRLRLVNGDGVALNHGIKHSKSCAYARLSRPASDLAQPSVGFRRRVRQSDTRRKRIALRNQRIRNSGIGGINQAPRRRRENFGLLPQDKRRNLVVLL